jgi:phosphotransferase system enzyme I (PtsI)
VEKFAGVGSTPLSGVGTARWYRPAALSLPERPAPEAVDSAAERERLERAGDEARAAIREARERAAVAAGEDEAAVFEAHEQFLDDPGLVGPVEDAIDNGAPAEHAVHETYADAIAQFEEMEGRTAERADDLRDVRDRLLRALLGVATADLGWLPDGTVLLAERLTPSDTATIDPDAVAGIATATGGRTSHAAIIARSLAIPAIVGVGDDLDRVSDGATVLVDGEAGEVVVDPDAERRAAASDLDAPVVESRVATADGHAIEVAANVGRPAEMDPAAARGADGIGLFRTEFLFLDRDSSPDEDEQYKSIMAALAAFPGDRVVVRTLDIGGDKRVPYLDLPDEPNPFLGRRGLRLSLGEHASLFETQLRAFLRAAATDAGDGLCVMAPMVARVEEVERLLERVEGVAMTLEDEGVAHEVPALGAMVETPGAAFVAGELADRLEFLSVGTNDLAGYVMAADRENDQVAELRDPLHPAVLRAIDRTVTAAHKSGAWVGICGEMAGDPALTELLIGLGLDELSMSAVTVPAVKARVRETDTERATALAEEVLACETRAAVRDRLDDAA